MYEVSGYDIKKFFNTSGVKYRELGLKDVVKTESDEKLLERLIQWYEKNIERGLPERNVNTTAPMLTLAFIAEHTGNKK